MKQSIFVQNFSIAVGSNTTRSEFTPKNGKIIGACIYLDDETIIGQAALVGQTGSPIIDSVDLRHWKRREAAYKDSYIPVKVGSQPMTLNIKLNANVSGTPFTGQLVLIYEIEEEC
jgi:hypothetical protein